MVYDDVKILTKKNPYFPKRFLELKDFPEVIFVRGDETILNEFALAIVGARKASFEGMRVCREIAGGFAERGINIVSGLAVGIDSESHVELVEVSAPSHPIVILGGGIDQIYPSANKKLAEKILAAGGAIISEYFPRRTILANTSA